MILLRDLIRVIEERMAKKAVLDMKPMQAGDVLITYADINKTRAEIGYNPQYDLKTGIDHFVNWYMHNKSILYPDIH